MNIEIKLSYIRDSQKKSKFFFGEDSSQHGFARPDTLGVYIDNTYMAEFYEEKNSQIEKMKNLSEQEVRDVDLSVYLLPFEQVLAHEAYHIYQFLTCTIISEYASVMRRKGRLELKFLHQLLSQNTKLISGKEILSYSAFDDDVQQYINRISDESYNEIKKIDRKLTSNHLSLREIIEACAVSFQLISQNDYLNKKIPISDPLYNRAWDMFVGKLDIEVNNAAIAMIARLVFLFAGDVYLKYSHNDFQDTNDFEEALDLVSFLVGNFHKYIEEFNGGEKIRDEKFIKSIKDVERDDALIGEIIEYAGTLSSDKQIHLYSNIRLYSDIFKRISLSGAPDRKRPNNNKNRAVNRRIKSFFPYWESDFAIPCIISDFEQSSKFSTLWMRINETKFMDEIEQQSFTLEEDNFSLDFINNFSNILLAPNSGARCCTKHGYEDIVQKIMTCTELDSLNQCCIDAFGKPLRNIINYG